jgi:hypothetical protein
MKRDYSHLATATTRAAPHAVARRRPIGRRVGGRRRGCQATSGTDTGGSLRCRPTGAGIALAESQRAALRLALLSKVEVDPIWGPVAWLGGGSFRHDRRSGR